MTNDETNTLETIKTALPSYSFWKQYCGSVFQSDYWERVRKSPSTQVCHVECEKPSFL